jgi:hypothetical protein
MEIWTDDTKNTSTFTNESKSSGTIGTFDVAKFDIGKFDSTERTTWSDESKNTATFTNDTKN